MTFSTIIYSIVMGFLVLVCIYDIYDESKPYDKYGNPRYVNPGKVYNAWLKLICVIILFIAGLFMGGPIK